MVACLETTLFFGGWQVPYLMRDGFHFPWGMALPISQWAYSSSGLPAFQRRSWVCWLLMQIRWTLPRFRYDQLMRLGWLGLFPISVANLRVTALVLALFGGRS